MSRLEQLLERPCGETQQLYLLHLKMRYFSAVVKTKVLRLKMRYWLRAYAWLY